jgi:hypothetical protein
MAEPVEMIVPPLREMRADIEALELKVQELEAQK